MNKPYHSFSVQSSSWDEIAVGFDPAHTPGMLTFIEWLRNSKYAFGLFAVTSLDILVIGQTEHFELHRNVIRLEEVGEKFHLTFRECETAESTGTFEKTEIIPAFERLLSSLRWFSIND